MTPPSLTAKQRAVYGLAVHYYAATGEPCSLSYLARRLNRHPKTIRARLLAIAHKGWIRADTPAFRRLHV